MASSKLQMLFNRIRPAVAANITLRPDAFPDYILFASFTDGARRARTVTATGDTFDQCWARLVKLAEKARQTAALAPVWLRVDWGRRINPMTWASLASQLRKIKRNYHRCGLSLDSNFRHAFLETELNANAMLYGGPGARTCVVNEKNFRRYARIRHGIAGFSMAPSDEVIQFSTFGAFVALDDAHVRLLPGTGRDAGRRMPAPLAAPDVKSMVAAGSTYLATQVQEDGRFIYGWHPCFDRALPGYNCLRHASTLYAMIESWQLTQCPRTEAAIRRAMAQLSTGLIRKRQVSGRQAAFLV